MGASCQSAGSLVSELILYQSVKDRDTENSQHYPLISPSSSGPSLPAGAFTFFAARVWAASPTTAPAPPARAVLLSGGKRFPLRYPLIVGSSMGVGNGTGSLSPLPLSNVTETEPLPLSLPG